jgi:hypothetical protein
MKYKSLTILVCFWLHTENQMEKSDKKKKFNFLTSDDWKASKVTSPPNF